MDFQIITEFFSSVPPQLAVFLIATLPLAELQAAIPIGITIYDLSPITAYILSWAGSIVPSFFIIWLLGPVSGYLMQRFKIAQSFFSWLFARTRHKFSGKYEVWGSLALMLWAAVPLPGAGVWSASVASFLFGIPKKPSIIFIGLGSAIAGFLVALTTLGVIKFL